MMYRNEAAETMSEGTERQEKAEHRPGDFCRTCRGKGVLYDTDYRPGIGTVQIAQGCLACNGTGWGK